MTGAERAAIFLMTLGENEAAEIMQHLGPREVQQLGLAMSSLENVSKDQVNKVLNDFVTTVEEQTSLGIGNTDYIRSVLVKALGEDRAGSIIDRILMGGNTRGLEQLKWLDPRTIAEMVRLEHPQIIAIVLAYLDADQAAQVLAELPDRIRHDIVMRIATLESIQPAALQELDEIMERQFSGKQRIKSSSIGGAQSAANIMNYLDSSVESDVMEHIQTADSELGDQIQDLMFVFDDLADVDDRGVQLLLREVGTDILVLALKGADDRVKDKVMRNLSKRAAEMLQDDLEAKGPVRVSEVEQAQKEILTVARRLADEGQIMLGGGGESFV
ncbi:Flagellar motor switch protein FliG [wastewater metagenome]|uniref:Flagellar motor switch protein FliG n=2 Tax=unclassified sequences TaxID=12908 RepID=A0A5B8R5J3_9ZZZZ|nr:MULTISPECIES: flagellar motor switch protein FliG [Arhodomonas]MCS4502796.1 flagellar motor switch protein FliG [Arhodomonas aquaeolei]QEA03721.1 flagellar motor switch protein FliG [uncultured organism]